MDMDTRFYCPDNSRHIYASGKCIKCKNPQQQLKKLEVKEVKKENNSNSERAYLISQFLEEINKTRDGVRYKKLTPQMISVKLAYINLEDLKWFWDSCWQEKNRKKAFNCKYFWWKMKK